MARFVTSFLKETDSVKKEVKRLSQLTKKYSVPYQENKDLGHFLDLITKSTEIPDPSELRSLAQNARAALRDIIFANQVVNAERSGEDNGLAVLLPDDYVDWGLYSDYYSQMSFPRDTGWDQLIQALLAISTGE